MNILICDAFDASLPGRLKKFGEVFDDIKKLPEAEVCLVRSKTKADKEFIDKAPNLRLIIRGGVGIDNIDVEYAKSKGIAVKNTPAASSIAVAELAFALMISMINHVAAADKSMKEGKWDKKKFKRSELFGKTFGLLGVGRIGTEVAKRAQAFGMKVYAFDPYLKEHNIATLIADLDEFLGKCDFISLHTPLTDETKGLVNKELILKMKDGVRLINTGRGKVVVEEDIVEALQSGKIAGYANDVWYSDPPINSPLINAPNVVLTPHIGASSQENLLRIGDIIVEILDSFNK